MASVDIFGTVAPTSVSSTMTATESTLTALTENTIVEPLTINDIKMFESLDLDSSGSSGIGNSNEAIIEGSLDEAEMLMDDANHHCKACKYVYF